MRRKTKTTLVQGGFCFARQYEQKGGDAAQQQQILLQRQADLRAEGKQTGEALLDLAAGALPLVLVEDLLQDVRRQAEEEHSSQVMGQALDRMEALLDGYAGDRAAAGQFVEYVKGCFPGREEEALYGLSSHGLVQSTRRRRPQQGSGTGRWRRTFRKRSSGTRRTGWRNIQRCRSVW